MAIAAARPDQPRYQYRAPKSESVETTYQAPEPVRTYEAPSEVVQTYEAPESSESYENLMPYDFGFKVDAESDTDAAYGHKSTSDGKKVVGQYRVELPDCRTQIVTYTADNESGFQAEVTYEGEVCEWVPPPKYSAEATYEAPRQTYEQPKNTYSAPQ